jgi:hypothetical protein
VAPRIAGGLTLDLSRPERKGRCLALYVRRFSDACGLRYLCAAAER